MSLVVKTPESPYETATFNTAVTAEVIPAPAAGFRIRIYGVSVNGTGGSLNFKSTAGAVAILMDSVTTGRPYFPQFPGGVAFDGGDGVTLVTGVSARGTIQFRTEADQ